MRRGRNVHYNEAMKRTELYSAGELSRLKTRLAVLRCVQGVLAAAGLALCVLLCARA